MSNADIDALGHDLQLLGTSERESDNGSEVRETDDSLRATISSLRTSAESVAREKKRLQRENEELREELSQSRQIIQRQMHILDSISSMRKPFSQPPTEILCMIFHRVVPPSFLLDSSISAGPESAWCKTLQQKKSLVLVCRDWYKTGVQFLYEDVTFRQIAHFAPFVRALEKSPLDLGRLVKKITIYCLIPASYSGLFRARLMRIFGLCPRLNHFAYTSPCRLPRSDLLPLMPSSITRLSFSSAIQLQTLVSTLMPLCETLVSLSFEIPLFDVGSPGCPTISFHRLESLYVSVTPFTRRHLDFIGARWKMPCLQKLTFKLNGNPASWEPALVMTQFISFCSAHGRILKYLHIHPEYWWSMADYSVDIQQLLDFCPKLEHLVLHPKTSIPLTHSNVKWIDLWEPHATNASAEEWNKLRQNLMKDSFPSLIRMRTLFAGLSYLPDLPLMIPPTVVTTELEEFEIRFLDLYIHYDLDNLRSMDPVWPGEDDDSDDSLYEDGPDEDSEWNNSTSYSSAEFSDASEDDIDDDYSIHPDWDTNPDISLEVFSSL